ncbi:hypothetical protein [Tengunoibacter tsumagoiensis]|uniref:Uncharacterized protein n=1 Tax=Tengunoibacter tsumagoiensis TaxID=2014871 RepID=A0A402AAB3_9CHLR|nr:hypothetical protein [Tengunoibacter tsumagoiensis]GCE15976.1 hypothetical protein KTT_58350 [Tengunoibacter tsumagoiensis]
MQQQPYWRYDRHLASTDRLPSPQTLPQERTFFASFIQALAIIMLAPILIANLHPFFDQWCPALPDFFAHHHLTELNALLTTCLLLALLILFIGLFFVAFSTFYTILMVTLYYLALILLSLLLLNVVATTFAEQALQDMLLNGYAGILHFFDSLDPSLLPIVGVITLFLAYTFNAYLALKYVERKRVQQSPVLFLVETMAILSIFGDGVGGGKALFTLINSASLHPIKANLLASNAYPFSLAASIVLTLAFVFIEIAGAIPQTQANSPAFRRRMS